MDSLNLEIASGEIYGFVGPNGAGKSTCVRMLCTLLRPSGGQAFVGGCDVLEDPEGVRRRIGVALQDAALDDRQTGRELLLLQGRLFGLTRNEARCRVDEVLSLVDIGAAIDRRIGTYSGGMKRRLDLAAALVHRPEILFLDEPTTGLDPHSRRLVWSEVRRLSTEMGMTVFLTTQYLEEADELADRVGIIVGGRLVVEGPPTLLKRSQGRDLVVAVVDGADPLAIDRLSGLAGVEFVQAVGGRITVGTTDGPATIGSVAVILHESSLQVRSLTMRSPTLDDVFLTVTGASLERAPAA